MEKKLFLWRTSRAREEADAVFIDFYERREMGPSYGWSRGWWGEINARLIHELTQEAVVEVYRGFMRELAKAARRASGEGVITHRITIPAERTKSGKSLCLSFTASPDYRKASSPNCYECRWLLPDKKDRRCRCIHPKVRRKRDRQLATADMLLFSMYRPLGVRIENWLGDPSEHSAIYWPTAFDPEHLVTCDGYTPAWAPDARACHQPKADSYKMAWGKDISMSVEATPEGINYEITVTSLAWFYGRPEILTVIWGVVMLECGPDVAFNFLDELRCAWDNDFGHWGLTGDGWKYVRRFKGGPGAGSKTVKLSLFVKNTADLTSAKAVESSNA